MNPMIDRDALAFANHLEATGDRTAIRYARGIRLRCALWFVLWSSMWMGVGVALASIVLILVGAT